MPHPIRLALAALGAVAVLGACSPTPGPSGGGGGGGGDQTAAADRLALDACTKLVSFLEAQEGRKASLRGPAPDPKDPWAQLEAMNNSGAISDGTHPALRAAYTSNVTPLTDLTGGAARRDPAWDALNEAMTTSARNGYNAPALAAECGKALAE